MKYILSLIVLFLLYINISFSQNTFRFENISTQHKLYFNHVYTIIQDKFGFIWIADSTGISRFDGYSFTDFSNKEDDQNTIKETGIKFIFIDRDKNLWFAGDNLNRYDSKSEKFIKYPTYKLIFNSIPDSFPLFDIRTKKIVKIKFPEIIRNKKKFNVNIFTAITENNFWMKFDRIDSDFIYSIPIDYTDTTKKLRGSLIYAGQQIGIIWADSKETLWTIQNGIVKYFSNEKKCFVNFIQLPSKEKDEISCMYRDNNDKLWLGCNHYKGLICIDLKTKMFLNIKADIPGKDRLYANNITNIFEDSFGTMWISTENNSIYITNMNIKKFELYDIVQGLPGNNINSVFEDSQANRYFGSSNGLAVLKSDNSLQIYKYDEGKLPHIFINNMFNDFCELPGNNLLAAGVGLSVVNFYTKDYRYLLPDHSDSSLASWVIYNINKGQKSGHYWISCQHGLNEIDNFNIQKSKGNITKKIYPRIKLFNEKALGEHINVIWSSYEDKDGMVWCCSSNGVFRYDPAKNTFKHFPTDINNPNTLQAMDVNCCCEDSKNRLWFATIGGGISRFDRKTEKFYTITKKDGLPSNSIYGILEDSKGNLWMSSNNGLCRYNPDSNQIQCYDENDGVQGTMFNKKAFFKTPAGKMYFGGTNGVTAFYPDSIKTNLIATKVFLSKLFVNNKPVKVAEVINGNRILKQSLMETKQIVLSNRNHIFAIEFSCIQTVAPERVKCQYIMEGYDKEWITTFAYPRRAHYSNLPAGSYVFKVKASNGDRIWNSQECSIGFKIKPPFYKTLWFIILYILVGILIINFYIKYRERKLNKDKQLLEKKVEQRTLQLKEANEELSTQADILAIQKEELAVKNKDITDSILYARRIQKALLPQHVIEQNKDIFVYFCPKDIVSGDFYWLAYGGGKKFIACVDCTGHGVPGAFISIIGTNILNKIIKEYRLYKPSEILFMLNNELINTLKSDNIEDEVKNGMDLISYCC